MPLGPQARPKPRRSHPSRCLSDRATARVPREICCATSNAARSPRQNGSCRPRRLPLGCAPGAGGPPPRRSPLDLALRQVAVANHPTAAVPDTQIGMPLYECRNLCFHSLGQKLARSGAQNLRQRILRKFPWLAKLNNSFILRGISFPLPELATRHRQNTPPSNHAVPNFRV